MVDSLRPTRQAPGQAVTDRPVQQAQPQVQVQPPPQAQAQLPGPAQATRGQNPASDFRQIAEAAGANVPNAPPVFLVPDGGRRGPQMAPPDGQTQDNRMWPIVVDLDEKKGRSKGWILVVLALIVGAGAGGAFYAKRNGLLGSILGSKGPSKQAPTVNGQSRPSRPVVPLTSPSPRSSAAVQTSASPQ
ncbi:MAG: hypothetical protein ACREAC_13135, partial [Blastocatellia bacterium]